MKAAEEMNFTTAAAQLYVTQQTLSDHIKRLEKNYHVTLFNRRPTLSLTPEGELMVKYARRILQLEREMNAEMAQINRYAQGSLSLGISRMRSRFFVPSIWKEYEQLYPNIKIKLLHRDSDLLENLVESRDVDVALVIDPRPGLNICSEKVLEEPLFAVVNKTAFQNHFGDEAVSIAERFSKGITPRDLKGFDIMYSNNSRMERIVTAAFQQYDFVPNPVFVSKDQELLFQMAEAGRGVAYVSSLCLFTPGTNYRDALRNVYIFPLESMSFPYSVMYLDDGAMPDYKRTFIDICRKVIGDSEQYLNEARSKALAYQISKNK